MRTPEEIIGHDALLQLIFEGYEVVRADAPPLFTDLGDDFDTFWQAYPRKTAKPAALKAYKAARKRKAAHADIMAGVARLVASRPDPQFTPHPATWLNGDRWNDAPTPPSLKGIEARQADLRQRIANDYGMERPGSPDPRDAGRLRIERR